MLVGPPRSSPVSHFWFLGRRPASRGGSPIVSPCAPARYGFQKLGMHRLEAIKKIGMGLIECDVFDTQREARMWEISENLHRNDLDRIQRAQHEAEWIKLREEEEHGKMGQLGPFSKVGAGRGNEGGIRLAARELPVPGDSEEAKRHRLRRDMAIASAGDEPLEEARKAGLANNERALLEVARAPEDQRVAKVHEIADRKAASIFRSLSIPDGPAASRAETRSPRAARETISSRSSGSICARASSSTPLSREVPAMSFRASPRAAPRAASRRMVRSSRPVFEAASAVKATDNLSVATPCLIRPCRTCAFASGCRAS